MARIAIGVEYDGTAFSGWQSQPHARNVQAALEAALASVAAHPVAVTAAGRTDAGVHAALQIVHFDSEALRSERDWVHGANDGAPADLTVLWARRVADGFHARFDALSRSYRYRILNRAVRPAIERSRVCWIRETLDVAAMHAAAQSLIGSHDFSSFRASECQSRTARRNLMSIDVSSDGVEVTIRVTANAFLHHMVRNIAGTLLAVGRGRQPAGWVAEVLAARDRRVGGVTAPPQGLYFAGARYADGYGLPGPG